MGGQESGLVGMRTQTNTVENTSENTTRKVSDVGHQTEFTIVA